MIMRIGNQPSVNGIVITFSDGKSSEIKEMSEDQLISYGNYMAHVGITQDQAMLYNSRVHWMYWLVVRIPFQWVNNLYAKYIVYKTGKEYRRYAKISTYIAKAKRDQLIKN